jgi:hypothetical protein
LAKNGSFGFTKRRLVCRAKPNVFRQKEILKNVNGELFFFHLSKEQNTVSLIVCPLDRNGLYVVSIFSHCLLIRLFFKLWWQRFAALKTQMFD